MENSIYVLNPGYRLRQDGSRVVLASFDNKSLNAVDDWLSFIHPLQAQMLSFFSVPRPLHESIGACAKYMRLDIDSMTRIITPFLDNKEPIGISLKQGGNAYFPEHVITTSNGTEAVNAPAYAVTDFVINDPVDLETYRLAYPININMELTMKCYVNCIYCYANRNLQDKSVLSTGRILDFIEECEKQRVFNLDINGGEVLLHPDIESILEKLVKCGYRPLISTKKPIDKKMLSYLKSIGIDSFQISIDSANNNILTSLIKAPKGYIDKISETLHNAAHYGMQIDVNSVICSYNSSIDDLEQLLKFLSLHKAVRRVRLSPAGYSLYKGNYAEIAPKLDDLHRLENYIIENSSKYPFIINVSGYDEKCMFEPENKIKSFPKRAICTGNVRNAVILPNGDVTICEELYDHPAFVIGNIKKQSLKEIWNSEKALALYEFSLKQNNSVCHECEDKHLCRKKKGVCWKSVLMAYGADKWDFPDPRCPKAPYPYNQFFMS